MYFNTLNDLNFFGSSIKEIARGSFKFFISLQNIVIPNSVQKKISGNSNGKTKVFNSTDSDKNDSEF